MLVVEQNWFRGLVNELHAVVIVSQIPVFVCKQLRKTVKRHHLFQCKCITEHIITQFNQ